MDSDSHLERKSYVLMYDRIRVRTISAQDDYRSPSWSNRTRGSGHGRGDQENGQNVETAFPWELEGDQGTYKELSGS